MCEYLYFLIFLLCWWKPRARTHTHTKIYVFVMVSFLSIKIATGILCTKVRDQHGCELKESYLGLAPSSVKIKVRFERCLFIFSQFKALLGYAEKISDWFRFSLQKRITGLDTLLFLISVLHWQTNIDLCSTFKTHS